MTHDDKGRETMQEVFAKIAPKHGINVETFKQRPDEYKFQHATEMFKFFAETWQAALATVSTAQPVETAQETIAQLQAALRSLNAVAIERGDKFGACDQIDNDGQPYQSKFLADLLAAPSKPLDTSELRAMLNAAPAVSTAQPVAQEPWHKKVIGVEVSMDVSTGEHDADNRIYGRVNEVMIPEGGNGVYTILAEEESRNFTAAAPVSAEAIRREALEEAAKICKGTDVVTLGSFYDYGNGRATLEKAAKAIRALASHPGCRHQSGSTPKWNHSVCNDCGAIL